MTPAHASYNSPRSTRLKDTDVIHDHPAGNDAGSHHCRRQRLARRPVALARPPLPRRQRLDGARHPLRARALRRLSAAVSGKPTGQQEVAMPHGCPGQSGAPTLPIANIYYLTKPSIKYIVLPISAGVPRALACGIVKRVTTFCARFRSADSPSVATHLLPALLVRRAITT